MRPYKCYGRRYSAADTCALLADQGFISTAPFAEVTGGDLLGLSWEELTQELGLSHLQVAPACSRRVCTIQLLPLQCAAIQK